MIGRVGQSAEAPHVGGVLGPYSVLRLHAFWSGDQYRGVVVRISRRERCKYLTRTITGVTSRVNGERRRAWIDKRLCDTVPCNQQKTSRRGAECVSVCVVPAVKTNPPSYFPVPRVGVHVRPYPTEQLRARLLYRLGRWYDRGTGAMIRQRQRGDDTTETPRRRGHEQEGRRARPFSIASIRETYDSMDRNQHESTRSGKL